MQSASGQMDRKSRPSLVSELRVEPEDVDEAGDVETLEITVGEGAHVAARLDHQAGGGGVSPHVMVVLLGVLLGQGQVLRDVAAHKVALAWWKIMVGFFITLYWVIQL